MALLCYMLRPSRIFPVSALLELYSVSFMPRLIFSVLTVKIRIQLCPAEYACSSMCNYHRPRQIRTRRLPSLRCRCNHSDGISPHISGASVFVIVPPPFESAPVISTTSEAIPFAKVSMPIKAAPLQRRCAAFLRHSQSRRCIYKPQNPQNRKLYSM